MREKNKRKQNEYGPDLRKYQTSVSIMSFSITDKP